MKTLIVLLLFVGSLQVARGQNGNTVMISDSAKANARHTIDSLHHIVLFLEDILHTVENAKTDAKNQVEKMGAYLRRGGREMEACLASNFSKLHPGNETMKADLIQRLHFIMQSLALYRSDLRSSDYQETNSSIKEYEFLTSRIPELLERLKHMMTYHRYTDWDKQKKLDELNGYMQDAYGQDAPLRFAIDAIYFKNYKSLDWRDVTGMTVNRNKGKVSITTLSGRLIQFDFTQEQYTHIASMHVHFLAFFKKMQE